MGITANQAGQLSAKARDLISKPNSMTAYLVVGALVQDDTNGLLAQRIIPQVTHADIET